LNSQSTISPPFDVLKARSSVLVSNRRFEHLRDEEMSSSTMSPPSLDEAAKLSLSVENLMLVAFTLVGIGTALAIPSLVFPARRSED
jgi:hypothetical protein